MVLRLEVVGDGPGAERLLAKLAALNDFDVATVRAPRRSPEIRPPQSQTSECVDVIGNRKGAALLQENRTTGEIEGLPVVTIDLRRAS